MNKCLEFMHLAHLKYLQAVAKHGSLSAAARALGVKQPTLSGAVQTLEDEFKTVLVHRGRDGVKLTAAGETMLRHATSLFATFEQMQQDIQGLEAEPTGRMVLGCHESLGAYFLPGFLRDFLSQWPTIDVTLWNGTSATVRDAILAHDVHFGLLVNPIAHPDLVLVKLFHDAMDFFVCVDEPSYASLAQAHARIEHGPIVYANRVQQCHELLGRLSAEGTHPARLLSCGDLELVKSMTLSGIGVGVLPRRVAAYGHPHRLRRLHPELPFIPDTIYLAWRSDLHRTSAAVRLKDSLVSYGRTMTEM
jgi:molybdate transport repressor ModE-like protein